MKVLQISNKVPYPEKDGGAIAINAITEGLLKAGCEVHLLAMNTKKHFIDIYSIPEKYRNERHLQAVAIDTDVKHFAALFALLSGKSYNISRFHSKEFSQKLVGILQKEKFDIIQLEGIYLAPYIPVIRKYTIAPVILRAANVEWQIWQKLAAEEKNKLKKWYLTILSKQLKRYEEKAVNLFDGVATITNSDRKYLQQAGCTASLATIPFGVDISKYTMGEAKYPNTLFYIGALDWLPNLQGIDWFLKNVWHLVRQKFPNAEFHIAGRNMPEALRNSKYPGVVFHGEIENAKIFIADYDIMLVPLLAGSGVRVKIIEGMAMGKPIVSTSIGVEGIECTFGKDILVADTPEQFADAVCQCLQNEKLKQSIGQCARMFVEENYDSIRIINDLLQFYKDRK